MMHRLMESLTAGYSRRPGSPGPSANDVRNAYWLLFGREPENKDVVEHHRSGNPDVWSLLGGLMKSPEFAARAPDFIPPRTTFDGQPLRARFEQLDAPLRPGYVTDLLGLHTDVRYLNPGMQHEGRINGLPVAGDLHCTAAETLAGLRGVDLGRDEFVAVELGAGWGAWMAILCRAARIRGASSTLAIGCEADPLHCQMLHRHLAVNGFSRREYRLFEGAVAASRGMALFPVSSDSSQDWGLRPHFCRSDREADELLANPAADYRGFAFERYQKVACYVLADVVAGLSQIDVMHIDVQGSEYELVRQNLELLNSRVGYLIIGTHGRHIEGQLIELLSNAGWQLEVEEPCQFDLHSPRFSPRVDGIQGWRNRNLRPVGSAC